MKNLCLAFIFCFCVVVGVSGQDSQAGSLRSDGCPADKVCISREAAIKAVADAETVKAQAGEIAALKQALADEKDVAARLKVEFAEKSGEVTALKQNAVSDRAIIEILVKKVGKRCSPLSILCL